MSFEKQKIILSNKRVFYLYESYGSYECGMALSGGDVKKILTHKVSLAGGHGWIKKDEIWLRGLTNESIKLLLNKTEIKKIISDTKEKKYLLIPVEIYLKNRKLKVKMALTKRKKIENKEKLKSIRKKDTKKLDEWY